MSVRTKVLVLLLGLLGFLVAASGVSVAVRARAETALARVTQRDVPLLGLSTHVTTVHLEQALQLERALRAMERPDSQSPAAVADARTAFEHQAAIIWHRLRDALELARAAAQAGDPDAQARLLGVERIDAAHNHYAERVRAAFDDLERGDLAAARPALEGAGASKEELERVLGDVLAQAARSAAEASAVAGRDARAARTVVWVLLALGLGAAAGVFALVVRMVSDIRTLSGLLPICAQCKKIRDDQGYWNQLEAYLQSHSHATLTHGICRDCQAAMHEKIVRSREAGAPA